VIPYPDCAVCRAYTAAEFHENRKNRPDIMSFTILMSVYHKEKPHYLNDCLQSLLVQSRKADKVVLVEDGAISKYLKEVIEKYRSPLNIQSVILDNNYGLATALNEGLMFCDSELVVRMDSDDISLPYRCERQIEYMSENPNISVSSAYIEEVDEMDNVTGYRVLPLDNESIRKFAIKRNPISHPCSVFRRSDVLSVGGYPLLRTSQDYALWSVMMVNGFKFGNIDEVLLKMRTGSVFYRRRGYQYLKHEIELLRFQRDINFLTPLDYCINLAYRSVLRLSPAFVKDILYKKLR
jgi:amylovoran biosynthesis glycosyltransferase AmsE